MRLINTETLQLEENLNEDEVTYAILSHRWENEEVSFREMTTNLHASRMAGHYKIQKCCAEAAENIVHYAWVDTCCIDKSSSAELQEAINSMFHWYSKAFVCYVYLSDVDANAAGDDFRDSQWFSRGWTLQELIAPTRVEFYDKGWNYIGTRDSLAPSLSLVTRIPEAILRGQHRNLSVYSIAERMSWASGRKTTRIEDRAYSLLGIFDVNMPMLYGEREKAFIRLQEEILRRSNDQSILAWTGIHGVNCGVLAPSPDCFPQESVKRIWESHFNFERRASHAITNEGLSLELELTPWRPDVYLAFLNYRWRLLLTSELSESSSYREGIFLKRLDSGDRFLRVAEESHGALYRGVSEWQTSARLLTRDGLPCRTQRVTIVQSIMGQTEAFRCTIYPVAGYKVHSEASWLQAPKASRLRLQDPQFSFLLQPGEYGPAGYFSVPVQSIGEVMLGFDFDYRPVIVIETTVTRHLPSSFGHDLSLRSLNQISCMESDGWYEIFGGQSFYQAHSELRSHQYLWPLKLGPEANAYGIFKLAIYMSSNEGHAGHESHNDGTQLVQIILWRASCVTPWNVVFHDPPYHKLQDIVNKLPGVYCEWSSL